MDFEISNEEKGKAVIDLLTDIYTQNRVLAEMMLPVYCEIKQLSYPEAREGLNDFFMKKKLDKMDYLYGNYGEVNLADIIGNQPKTD